MILTSGIFIFLSAISLLILLQYADSIEEENGLREAELNSVRLYNEALTERTNRIRRLRHDTLGLLQAIDNADDRAKGKAKDRVSFAALRMPLLNAIIELKQKQSKEQGIDFKVDVNIPGYLSASGRPEETDLCLLVQNMLDNAYEANLRNAESGERYMSLRIAADDGEAGAGDDAVERISALTVTVSNSVSAGERLSFITRKPNPELHGIGTGIIDEIIRKYDGRKQVDYAAAERRLTITARLFARK